LKDKIEKKNQINKWIENKKSKSKEWEWELNFLKIENQDYESKDEIKNKLKK
jgi:hypothetical protein